MMPEIELYLYNSLTKRKELFENLQYGHVTMYVCGPTPYDYLHIGNARPMVVFDSLARYFRIKAFTVDHVQNFTDIDDKIIQRAREMGEDAQALSAKYMAEANYDMFALGINKDLLKAQPTVTEEMPAIIDMITTLLEKGNAYEVDGNVYFHTPSYPDYGVLKRINPDELQTRLDDDTHGKKHPMDFVLWKAKKEGEPSFDAPWGPGRPGWHIECSAMIKSHLGETIDIHAGGGDLMFPHHENEIAQSMCANDNAPLARYFLHNGFVTIDNDKMSKSTGNVLTVREAGEKYGYAVLRFFLLSSHYRSDLSYSDEAMAAAKKGLERVINCHRRLSGFRDNYIEIEKTRKLTREEMFPDDREKEIEQEGWQIIKNFEHAMEDDINTALAIGHMFDFVKLANTQVTASSSYDYLTFFLAFLADEMLETLGINPEKYQPTSAQNPDQFPMIEALVNERTQAKENKDYARADAIRDQLAAMGVSVEDKYHSITWRYK